MSQSLLHEQNFEHYITQYANANDLPMSGQVWQAALAADVAYHGMEEAGFEVEPTHLDVMSQLAQNPPSPHYHDAMFAVGAKQGDNWENVYHTPFQGTNPRSGNKLYFNFISKS